MSSFHLQHFICNIYRPHPPPIYDCSYPTGLQKLNSELAKRLYFHSFLSALPGPARITVQAPTNLPAQLTVTWTPPTTGGVPTSYNVTINDSSSPVVVIADNRPPVYTHVFTGLISDTLYAVSVVAINCAGTSNVTSQKGLTG